MSYLLDTCILSELRKNVPEKTRVWFENKDQDQFFISVVTLAELWDGIERLPKSKRRNDLQDWFHGEIHSRFKDRILTIDDRVAMEWGFLNAGLRRKGVTMGVQDLYIAATVKSHSLVLVTVNIKDFQAADIPLVNPWTDM
jgi:predicted nucleic acid-binding protein